MCKYSSGLYQFFFFVLLFVLLEYQFCRKILLVALITIHTLLFPLLFIFMII